MLTTRLDPVFPLAKRLVLDIETTGLSPWQDRVTVIAVSDGKSTVIVDVRDTPHQRVAAWLREWVYNREIIIHNAQFDLTFLAVNFDVGYPERVWCTLVAESLLTAGMHRDEDDDDDEDSQPLPKDLKATIERRLGVSIEKRKDLQLAFGWDAVITPEMVQYVTDDVQYLARVQRVQEQAIANEGMEIVCGIEMACVPVFCEMFRRGIAIDVDGLKPLIAKASEAAKREEAKLQALLTPHVAWARIRRQDEIDTKIKEWQERRDAAEVQFSDDWQSWAEQGSLGTATTIWRHQWAGHKIEGAKDKAGNQIQITSEEIETWADETLRKDGTGPAGRARFVRRMMQLWAAKKENARPPSKRVDINEAINIRSNDQMRDAIQEYTRIYKIEHRGEPGVAELKPPEDLKKRTLTAMSVDAPAVYRDELLLPKLEFNKNDKLVNSFGQKLIDKLREEAGILVLSGGWRQCGTATGRPSCSDPNMLNMPNNGDFRGKFVARPGHLLVVADFSQIELRILAELSGDPTMIAVFRENRDLHLQTATDIYSVAPEAVTDTQRKTAKIINFGIAYGMAARAMRLNLAGWKVFITEEEAKHALDTWRRVYSAAARFIEQQGKAATRDGHADTALGRRRYMRKVDRNTPRFLVGKVQREGANHPIQGGNADLTKLAMVLMHPELKRLGGAVLLQVYDEIVVEVPEQYAWEARDIVVGAMTLAAGSVLKMVPVKVDAVVSPTWNEKDAIERK